MFYKSHNKVKTLCSKFYIQALISICCIGMSRAVEGGKNQQVRVSTRHSLTNPNSCLEWLTCFSGLREVSRLNAIERKKDQEQKMEDLISDVRDIKSTIQNRLGPSALQTERLDSLVDMVHKMAKSDSPYCTPVSFARIPELSPADPNLYQNYTLKCREDAQNMAAIMAKMIKCENSSSDNMFALIINAFCGIPSTDANPNEAEFRKNLEQRHYDMLLEPLNNQLKQYLSNAENYQRELGKSTITGCQKTFIQNQKLPILQKITNALQHAHDTLPQKASKPKIDDDQVQNLQTYLMRLVNKMDKIAIIQEIIALLPTMIINCLANSNPDTNLRWQTLPEALDDIRHMNLQDQLSKIGEMHNHYAKLCKKNAYETDQSNTDRTDQFNTDRTDQASAAKKITGQLNNARFLISHMQSMQYKIDTLLSPYDQHFINRVNEVHYELSKLCIENEIVNSKSPQVQQLEQSAVSIMRWINQYKSDESQDTGPAQSNIDGLIGFLTNRKAIWGSVDE